VRHRSGRSTQTRSWVARGQGWSTASSSSLECCIRRCSARRRHPLPAASP